MYDYAFISLFFPALAGFLALATSFVDVYFYREISDLYKKATDRVNRNLQEEVDMHKRYNLDYSLGGIKTKYEQAMEAINTDYKRVLLFATLALLVKLCVVFMSIAWIFESINLPFFGSTVDLPDPQKHSIIGGAIAGMIFTTLESRNLQAFRYYHG